MLLQKQTLYPHRLLLTFRHVSIALSVGSFGFYYRYPAGTQTNNPLCRMVSAVTDGEAESTENFSVVLADPISGIIGSQSTTMINIANVGKIVFHTKF